LPNQNVSQEWVGYRAAERLSSLSRTDLRRLIGNGQLRAAKIGRVTRIEKRSLEAFMEHHPTQPQLPGFDDADQ